MGKNKAKLVLDKNTVKSLKLKTELKTGVELGETKSCPSNGGPVSTSGNFTRNGGIISVNL